MIALIVFLLCGLAGATALIMASSNVGRYAHSEEQEYYTVSSAALVLVDMLDGLNYTSQTVSYEYIREWRYENDKRTETDSYRLTVPMLGETAETTGMGTMKGASTLSSSSHFKMVDAIRKQCDKVVPLFVPAEWYARVAEQADSPKKPDTVSSISFPFSVSLKDNTAVNEVKATLLMNANFDLVLTFYGGKGEYSITVFWKATIDPVQKANTPKTDYLTPEGTEYRDGKMTQINTYQAVVTWSRENATISRGEAIQNAAT